MNRRAKIAIEMLKLGCSLVLPVLFTSCTSRALRTGGAADEPSAVFDSTEFSRTCFLAEDFVLDDRLAWSSTDSIMAEKPMLLDSLDQTWFVDKRSTMRLVFYGRYFPESGEYRPKYVFKADSSGALRRARTGVDGRAIQFARAVSTAAAEFRRMVDSMQVNVDYNHYIRRNADSSFSVWFFPAGYGNYCAQGLDFVLAVDQTGSTVTGRVVTGKYLHYFEIDKRQQTVELDNTYAATPSIGNVFFVLNNRDRFDRIVINNSGSTSAMVYSADRKVWEWVHEQRSDTTTGGQSTPPPGSPR
jgi:hypothetical protein